MPQKKQSQKHKRQPTDRQVCCPSHIYKVLIFKINKGLLENNNNKIKNEQEV